MPRTKQQFEEMRKATREKIQSAAVQLFVQKGYGNTNVQDIADKAGISIGLLYRHYRTKEDLFHELVQFAVTGIKQIVELFETDESPAELINRFIAEVHRDMISGYDLANLMMLMSQSFMSGDEVIQNDIAMANRSLLQAASRLIERGQRLGDFAPGHSREMALFFFATIQGLAEMKIMLKNDFVMPSIAIWSAFLYKKGE